MIKDILLVSLSTTSVLFLLAYGFMAKRSSKLKKENSTLYIDNLTLKKFIAQEMNYKPSNQEIHKEKERKEKGLPRFVIKVIGEFWDWGRPALGVWA